MKKTLFLLCIVASIVASSIEGATVKDVRLSSEQLQVIVSWREAGLRKHPDAREAIKALAYFIGEATFVSVVVAATKALREICLTRPRLAINVVTALILQLKSDQAPGIRFILCEDLISIAAEYPSHAAGIQQAFSSLKEKLDAEPGGLRRQEILTLSDAIKRVKVPSLL